jgi:hypothetical protein
MVGPSGGGGGPAGGGGGLCGGGGGASMVGGGGRSDMAAGTRECSDLPVQSQRSWHEGSLYKHSLYAPYESPRVQGTPG